MRPGRRAQRAQVHAPLTRELLEVINIGGPALRPGAEGAEELGEGHEVEGSAVAPELRGGAGAVSLDVAEQAIGDGGTGQPGGERLYLRPERDALEVVHER